MVVVGFLTIPHVRRSLARMREIDGLQNSNLTPSHQLARDCFYFSHQGAPSSVCEGGSGFFAAS